MSAAKKNTLSPCPVPQDPESPYKQINLVLDNNGRILEISNKWTVRYGSMI